MNLSISTFKVSAESLLQVSKSGIGQLSHFHGNDCHLSGKMSLVGAQKI